MTYPEEFHTQNDSDGNHVLLERVHDDLVGMATDIDAVYLNRNDIPAMVAWLQDHYEETRPKLPELPHAVIRAEVRNGDTRVLTLLWSHERPEAERVWVNSLVTGGGTFFDNHIVSFEILFEGVSE